jgi:hypothetical protein
MMLAALVDRLKGISQAFSSCSAFDQQKGQARVPPISELYAW